MVLIPLLAGNIYYWWVVLFSAKLRSLNPFISREHLLPLTVFSDRWSWSLNPFISREHLLRYAFVHACSWGLVLIPLLAGNIYYRWLTWCWVMYQVLIPLLAGNIYYVSMLRRFIMKAVLIPLLAGNIYYYIGTSYTDGEGCLNPFISREHLLQPGTWVSYR